MSKRSILLINNHPFESGNPGQVDGLRLMETSGEIGAVTVVNAGPRIGESQCERDRRVTLEVHNSAADVVVALSLKRAIRDMDKMVAAIDARPIIYWEGDPWGPGKRVSPEMSAWLGLATHVFSVGGPPQAQLLKSHGAQTVHHTIHTYDHVLFGGSERRFCPGADSEVAFIGSNLSRMPLVSGLPGSMGRWRLIASLRRRYGNDLIVAGSGWPDKVSVGSVEFAEQDRFIQRARLLANWDHYPSIEAYTSDRLAIAMIAGRAQVSTLHPRMDWMPGAEAGLFLEATVGRVIRRTQELLRLPATDLADLGWAAHQWARLRISHREGIRHMLSKVFPDIERPPSDPWDQLPGPW